MMYRALHLQFYLLTAALVGLTSSQATAGFTFIESIHGEFSTESSAPTPFGIATPGSNVVMGAVGNLDADIFSFVIPTGFRLDSILLTSFSTSAPSARMFAALAEGDTFPYSFDEINSLENPPDLSLTMGAGLIGARFSDSQGGFFGAGVGDDILTFFGGPNRLGGTGFSTPLPAGTYTMFIQETGPISNYGLSINVAAVPEPSSAALMSLIVLGGSFYRRRALRL